MEPLIQGNDDVKKFEGGENDGKVKNTTIQDSSSSFNKDDASASGKDQQKKTKAQQDKEDKKDPLYRKKGMEVLRKYLVRFRGLIMIGLLFKLIGMVQELALPLYIGWLLDAITERDFDQVTTLAYNFLIIIFIGAFFSGIQSSIFVYTNQRFGQQLREDLYREIMRKDVEFFDSRKTGDLISRLNSDVQIIQDAVSNNFASVVKAIIFCMSVIVILVYISWQMTLFMLGLLIPQMCFFPTFGRLLGKIRKQVSDASAK